MEGLGPVVHTCVSLVQNESRIDHSLHVQSNVQASLRFSIMTGSCIFVAKWPVIYGAVSVREGLIIVS